MTATLAQLLQQQTVSQIFATLLGVYQANGFPVQSWQTGGVERTRLMAIATAIADISSNYIPGITAGGFLDYAPGTGWMPILASELYELTQNAAVNTVGNITLTAAAGSGPYIIAAGDLTAVFGLTLNRYINNTGGTLPLSGSLTLSFTAENAGSSYSDPSNSGNLTLATPLPGVTLTNPAGTYGAVTQTGSGTGTITLSGSPVGPHSINVEITSTGAAGVATWSYSIDGAAYVSAGAVSSLTNVGGVGINVTLVNGSSGTSFVVNDIYASYCPGSWITTQGANLESDATLAGRCRNRWASLSTVPTSGLYQLLAQSTPSVGAQVTQVITVPDATVNNKINLVVAGPAGALPGAAISLIQAYVSPRARGTDNPVVVSPTSLNVTLAGTITVSVSQLATAQVSIQAVISNYVNGVGINGTLRVAAIIDAIMNVSGVVDVSGVTINGSASNLTMGSSSSFVVPSLQPLTFAYVTQ